MAKNELRMPRVGETLKGMYRLERVLGEGGFAKAFAGQNLEDNSSVAVKALKLSETHQIIQFSKEAFRMLQYSHPNLTPVTDYDSEADTLPYIVMPLAPYSSLERDIQTRRRRGEGMPLQRTVVALEQTGEALSYLHERRVVHRDVKPDNILLPTDADFWLSDLGIVRVLKPNDSLRPEDMTGSIQYASPEQFYGRAGIPSDQYSLGITAYRLLTGRLPFVSELPAGADRLAVIMEYANKHAHQKPPSLAEAIESLQKSGVQFLMSSRH